ncbi:MAG: DUF2142 domain-containing protein [Acetobacter sp.]|uniref:DUF2142 domain-containing protein n=1 Tax=Acetobacter sp. TaxID=440 RepID=UPI0039E792F7
MDFLKINNFIDVFHRCDFSARVLGVFYFCSVLIVSLLLAILVPPFENSDEFNHFNRVYQISSGKMIAFRTGHPAQSGGVVDLGINKLDDIYSSIRFHADVKVTSSMMERGNAVLMGEKGFQSFPNTAIYSPLLYLPAVMGLDAARFSGVHRVKWALITSRMTTAIVCVSLASIAIALSGSAAIFLAVFLSLPMTISLFSSVSQDGLIICFSTLSFVFLCRFLHFVPSRLKGKEDLVLFYSFLSLSVLGRPAYAPLLLLPFFTQNSFKNKFNFFCFFISISFVAFWMLLVHFFVMIPMWDQTSPGKQVYNLITHPRLVPELIEHAFTDHQGMESLPFWKEVIGVVGWIDTVMPEWFYITALFVFVFSLIFVGQLRLKIDSYIRLRFGVAFLLLASVSLVFFLEYLTFTPVGQNFIVGVQGRYFLPLLPFLPFIILGYDGSVIKSRIRTIMLALSPGWIVVSSVVLLYSVLSRYYVM